MNEEIRLKNDILLLEYALTNEINKKFNLLLNEFQIIKLFSINTKNKREINFDTKNNSNIYQINTQFDTEKEHLIKEYNDDLQASGYLTKYNLIHRDNIEKIIEKRISLMINTKLTNLVSTIFVNNKINEIINIINNTLKQLNFDYANKMPQLKIQNEQEITNKNEFNFVINKINENNKMNIDFYYKNNLWEFAKLTFFPNDFFIDIDINLNNIFIYIFNRSLNQEIMSYPLTEKERKYLLSKKGLKPL